MNTNWIKKWVETNSEGTITNFLNNEREGLTAVQVPDEWNEPFCTRTTDFKLVQDENGINVVKPKNTLIIATWNEFNTVKPMINEVKKENEKLQKSLDDSETKYQNLLDKTKEVEQSSEDLGSLVVELQTELETLKGGN